MENNKSKVNIIIVVLAVALLALLIYITVTKAPNSNKDTVGVSNTATYPSTAKTLSIAEWGVEGKYLGSQPLQYEIKDNTLRFTSDNIKNVCGYNYSSFITRYTADQHIDQKGYGVVDASTKYTSSAKDSSLPKVHIGDYYYILTNSTASCIENSNDSKNAIVKNSDGLSTTVMSAQGDVSSEVRDLFLTMNKK